MNYLVTHEELGIIREALESENSLLALNVSHRAEDNIFNLSLTEDDANTLRDVCGDYLAIAGFDENYNAKGKGIVLERLIDKFYVK